MENQQVPYLPKSPGDLITAEAWNRLQWLIKSDIDQRVQKAVADIVMVPESGDSEKVSGRTAQELSDEILERALAAIPARTGYQQLFKRLTADQEKVVKHGLKAYPLVDIYQLGRFEAVCAVDEDKSIQLVTFYLYHSSEKKIRAGNATAEIEPTDGPAHKLSFSGLLDAYKVEYSDESSLGDLETEFWQAFFSAPNDPFDPDQYCHSPWFERCCREERTVKSLRSKGDWDELWVKVKPCKTINYTPTVEIPRGAPNSEPPPIQVCHYDWDTLGIRQIVDPTAPVLEVMVLLKV